MDDDASQPKRRQRSWVRVYLRHALQVWATGSLGLLAVHCGGAAMPEAQTPAAPEAVEAPDHVTEGEVQSARPTDAEQPASEASPELESDDIEESGTYDDKKSVHRESVVAGQLDLPQALAALEDFDAQLSATMELSTPDCAQAETFRGAICQLAERICTLEGGMPSSATERHCVDSRARCRAATERYRKTCQP